MRESRTYGFVRGALSNGRPYRVQDEVRATRALLRERQINDAAEEERPVLH